MKPTQYLNILDFKPLITPAALKQAMPASEQALQTVLSSRQVVRDILDKKDSRFLIVTGPCSIHDEKAAMEYAEKLARFKTTLGDSLYIVMRVYFEKPRTTVGWKGLINDPHLNNTFDIEAGLKLARKILLAVADLGLATGTEMLDPIVPQYLADLVSWAAIGARTTESQTHREMASGLSMPVGFKNNTEGNLQIAVDAMEAARHPHSFLGMDPDGRTCVVNTRGNAYGHIILRGGREMSNFDPGSVKQAADMVRGAGMNPALMVDCSHANSGKKHEKQEVAWRSIIEQRKAGNSDLIGMMLESHLFEGAQKLTSDLSKLTYGVSVTDACVGWETTESLLRWAAETLEG